MEIGSFILFQLQCGVEIVVGEEHRDNGKGNESKKKQILFKKEYLVEEGFHNRHEIILLLISFALIGITVSEIPPPNKYTNFYFFSHFNPQDISIINFFARNSFSILFVLLFVHNLCIFQPQI